MADSKTERRLAVCAVASLVLAATSGCTHSLYLHNGTNYALTPYQMVSKPPPAHYQAVPKSDIAPNTEAPIEKYGLHPVFYSPAAADPTHLEEPNGVHFKFFFNQPKGPWPVQYMVYHYQVPPGQEGKDPGKQPILLDKGSLAVTLPAKMKLVSVPKPGGGISWSVSLAP
jgi:hypothetical protein